MRYLRKLIWLGRWVVGSFVRLIFLPSSEDLSSPPPSGRRQGRWLTFRVYWYTVVAVDLGRGASQGAGPWKILTAAPGHQVPLHRGGVQLKLIHFLLKPRDVPLGTHNPLCDLVDLPVGLVEWCGHGCRIWLAAGCWLIGAHWGVIENSLIHWAIGLFIGGRPLDPQPRHLPLGPRLAKHLEEDLDWPVVDGWAVDDGRTARTRSCPRRRGRGANGTLRIRRRQGLQQFDSSLHAHQNFTVDGG